MLVNVGLELTSVRYGRFLAISHFFLEFEEEYIIMPLNSASFSTSDKMNQIDFWKPKFLVGLGFPYMGFLISGGLRPQKTNRRVYAFHRYQWFAVKLPVPGYGKIAVFWLWLRPR